MDAVPATATIKVGGGGGGSCQAIASAQVIDMQQFFVTFNVEFLPHCSPDGWPLPNFEEAVFHLLTEETVSMKAAGEDIGGVHVAASEPVSAIDRGPRSRDYVVRHTIRLDPPSADRAHLRPEDRVRVFLAEALGITPRQYEGPWNITGLTVRAA